MPILSIFTPRLKFHPQVIHNLQCQGLAILVDEKVELGNNPRKRPPQAGKSPVARSRETAVMRMTGV